MANLKHGLLILCSLWISYAAPVDDDRDPRVTIGQGILRGKTMRSNDGREFEAFLGIPYGKVTERFAKPKPGESWPGVRDATRDALSCTQYKLMGQNSTTEDCLTLNIYTTKNFTEDSDKKLLPVLVYIYGGGFVGGVSNSKAYGPGRFMDGVPIVLVLLNYRTGAFGFLSTHDEASPGNYGLLDQVLALEWVRDNIRSFGGDPAKVTISGESAGAASVLLHLLSPLSKDLFHGAIAQSGHTLRPWAVQNDQLNTTLAIARRLGCPTESTVSAVTCLKKVNADDLIIASNFSKIPGLYSLSTGPVIDGHFLTESPLKLLKEGRFNKVPVISGVTADETASWMTSLSGRGDKIPKSIREQQWRPLLSAMVQDDYDYMDNVTVREAIEEMYFHGVDANDTSGNLARIIEFLNDLLFNSGNDKTVRLLAARGIPVFMYVFDYSSWDISATNYTGHPDVSHTVELFLLFNKNTSSDFRYSDQTERISQAMVNLWTNFVSYGNPTPSGPLVWTPALPVERLKYLNISTHSEMKEGYLTERMKFWDNLLYD